MNLWSEISATLKLLMAILLVVTLMKLTGVHDSPFWFWLGISAILTGMFVLGRRYERLYDEGY